MNPTDPNPATPLQQPPVGVPPTPPAPSVTPVVSPTAPQTPMPAPIQTAVPQIPQPVQPGVVPAPPYGQVPNSLPGIPSTPSSSGNKWKIISGALAAIIILFVALAILGASVKTQVTYTSGDLITAQGQNYTFGVPKQWTNESNNTAFLQNVGFKGSAASGSEVYAYGVASSNKYATTIYASRIEQTHQTDAVLQQVLQNSVQKQLLTSELESSFSPSIVGCLSSSNNHDSVQLDNPNYVYELNMDYDCVIKNAAQNNNSTLSAHASIQVVAKGGYAISAILLTTSPDWTANANFYQKTMFPSIKLTT
jgi:hypothetical protein